jgi:hypothetical protein
MASSVLQRVIGIAVLIILFLAALHFKPIEGFVIYITGAVDQICPINSKKISYDSVRLLNLEDCSLDLTLLKNEHSKRVKNSILNSNPYFKKAFKI